MIYSFKQGDRNVWAVDRESWSKKGYAEDQPPLVTLLGGVALLLVPVIILSVMSPYDVLQVFGGVCGLVFLGLVVMLTRVMVQSERHWQDRQVKASELSEPSHPSGDLPAG